MKKLLKKIGKLENFEEKNGKNMQKARKIKNWDES